MRKYLCLCCILFMFMSVYAQHPSISLTPKGTKAIRAALGKYPSFDSSYAYAKQVADKAIALPIDVPIPKDAAGGYTHEQHKNNYYAMYYAGILYQVTGEKKYAQFVSDMLVAYAKIYPTLSLHPYVRSETPGKLFWQTLNETVWLVHTAMAYDCVYNFMTSDTRKFVEQNLFLPMADFIENGVPENHENYKTFNKMHNHATWATSAVGMIGYVMGNEDLVQRALYGSKKDGKSGFIMQMHQLLSPDGYFTEGAYYLRYAIWPFMLFAQTIELKQPEIQIFQMRDGILLKAVDVLLQQAYMGTIIKINDALTKTYESQEIVCAVDIAYGVSKDKRLLSIAEQQGNYILSEAGIVTAKAVIKNAAQPFEYTSMLLRDGSDGDKGGVALLRHGKGETNTLLVFKATSHGLSHGHYDKLTYSLYDNAQEVLTDYGAARFLNIESKSGGRYTRENYTYAMQTVAHNTVVADMQSHFMANIETSSKYASTINYCNISDSNVQIVSATDNNAYLDKNIEMQRTVALISDVCEYPVVFDIFKLKSPETHTYDFPFHYSGYLIDSNFGCKRNATSLVPMGTSDGYQHLWVECQSAISGHNVSFTWMNSNRFYSVTTTADNAQVYLVRAGANDPDMNIRSEPAVIVRQQEKANHVFASVVEPHGLFDLNLELTKAAQPQVKQIDVPFDNEDYTIMHVTLKNNTNIWLCVVNRNFDDKKEHQLNMDGKTYSWHGNYLLHVEK